MISNIIKTNDELTKNVIYSFKENGMPINELVLQKVIYKVKMDLGEDHPLYDDLPYYWYCYGPFSETLRFSFNESKKYLTPVGEKYSLNDKYLDEFKDYGLNDFPEVAESISNLISKGDYVYSALAEDIYKDFAPLDMLHEFKYGIFNPTGNDKFIGDEDAYVKSFRHCQCKLIPIIYLQDFSLIFTKFTRQIDILNDENLIAEKWNILKKPIKSLWFTFAQGLRCLEHDSFYSENYTQWDQKFQSSINNLDCKIDDFINKSDDWIDFTRYGDSSHDDRGFLGSLIDIYCEDD